MGLDSGGVSDADAATEWMPIAVVVLQIHDSNITTLYARHLYRRYCWPRVTLGDAGCVGEFRIGAIYWLGHDYGKGDVLIH